MELAEVTVRVHDLWLGESRQSVGAKGWWCSYRAKVTHREWDKAAILVVR